MKAHKTAIISDRAKIAKDVEIGPYAIVEDGVEIGEACKIGPHVSIFKGTTIGKACSFHIGAAIGDKPQDLASKDEESFVKIGNGNTFREYVTVHRGTKAGTSTVVGDNNYFMAFAHLAHNCNIGNDVIICNNSLLAGYVHVEDKAFISASCLIHQFVRIGKLAFIAGGVRINKDLPPYMTAENDNVVSAYNVVGLKRSGFDAKARGAIKEAYRVIYRSELNLSNALAELEKTNPGEDVQYLLNFIRASERGICFARSNRVEREKEAAPGA